MNALLLPIILLGCAGLILLIAGLVALLAGIRQQRLRTQESGGAGSGSAVLLMVLGAIGLILGLCLLLGGIAAVLFANIRSNSGGPFPQPLPQDATVPARPFDDLREERPLAPALPDPALTPASSGSLFQDDFSDPHSGWSQNIDTVGSTGYTGDGRYSLIINQPRYYVWTYPPYTLPGAGRLSDVVISFRSQFKTGDGEYGVFCRYQNDERASTYEVGFQAERYSIGKWVDGEYVSLRPDVWNRTPYLDPKFAGEDGFHQVEVSCVGQKIVLRINGYDIDSAVDSQYQNGGIAIYAFSGDRQEPLGEFYTRLLLDDFFLQIP